MLAITPGISAQDVEITEDRTTAIETVSLLGNGAATLTINSGVDVSAPTGPVITINGPHSLNLLGTITSLDSTSGVGIWANTSDADLVSDLTLDGNITLNGPDGFDLDLELETTNTGILIEGSGLFSGDITYEGGNAITVWGADSYGVRINSAFSGDLTLDGSITMSGNRSIGLSIEQAFTGDLTIGGSIAATNADSIALNLAGPINGAVVFEGVLTSGETASVDSDGAAVDAVPGVAAVHISNSITDGFLFQGTGVEFTEDGDGDDTTTLINSTVTTNGGTPVLLVTNDGTNGDLNIGAVSGLDYGLVMRGNMAVQGSSAGLPATGFFLEGASSAARTLVAGGLHFDTGVLNVSVIDAESTGIHISDYAETPTLYNRGRLVTESLLSTSTATDGTITYGAGGNATGLLIEENGVLTTFDNEGSFLVNGSGDGSTAIGILDRSGTLSTIRNDGNWLVVLTLPDAEGSQASPIALDARVNTSGISFENSGNIIGDIYLGSGDDTFESTDGTIVGDLDFGTGANTLTLSGETEFEGAISHTGTLDLFVADANLILAADREINVTTADFSGDSSISFVVNPGNETQGSLVATGNVTLGQSTLIDPDVQSFLFSENRYTLIDAGSLAVGADLDDMLTEVPYIYDTHLEFDGATDNSLVLAIRPKTATELGLDASPSILYEHFLDTELEADELLESAITNLTTRDGTNDAFTSLLGDFSASSMQLAVLMSELQRSQLNDSLSRFASEDNYERGFWARQFATYGNATSSSTSSWDSDFLSVGVSVGADFAINDNLVWGMNGGFALSGVSRNDDRGDELSGFTPFFGLYGLAKTGGLYLGLSGTATYHSFDRERQIQIGNLELLAESQNSAYQIDSSLIAGYRLQAGRFSLEPTVGVTALYYSESDYVEDGASSANLSVGKRSLSRVDAYTGLTAGFDIQWRGGNNPVTVRPEIFASYSKAVSGGDTGTIDIGFAQTGQFATFDVDKLGEVNKSAGVALKILGVGTNAVIRYTYKDREYLVAHEASLNFRLSF